MTVEFLTAAKIAEIAFTALVETGVGKLTEGAIAKGKDLWQKIRGKLQGNPTAEAAIAEVETHQSRENLEQKVVPFLQVAMLQDPQFASEIRQLAHQIDQEININNQTQKTQTQYISGQGKGYQIDAEEIGQVGDTYNYGNRSE